MHLVPPFPNTFHPFLPNPPPQILKLNPVLLTQPTPPLIRKKPLSNSLVILRSRTFFRILTDKFVIFLKQKFISRFIHHSIDIAVEIGH